MEKEAQPQSIDEALDWHASISRSITRNRAAALDSLRNGTPLADPDLIGLTESEINEFFDRERAEIDGMCIVNIVAAAEAAIRSDYRERIRRNHADLLSKAYTAFSKTLVGRKIWMPDFDKGGIVESLKDSASVAIHLVSDFRHALKIRHWYAHGRYWLLQTNAVEDPTSIHATCAALLNALPA